MVKEVCTIRTRTDCILDDAPNNNVTDKNEKELDVTARLRVCNSFRSSNIILFSR